ncbi:MAG: hypothetical protein NPIRA02_20900 [Nitrospirales bacterium]|nr:MAG: hypothetical protein NPIRA02_20900 [Nitrospirales bacterium]
MKCLAGLFSFLLFALSPIAAWTYTEEPVTNGGAISGTVLLDGKKPPALAYSIIANPDTAFCGRISTGTGWRVVDEFHISSEGGLKNAIVFLEGITKGKPFSDKDNAPSKVTVEDCVFEPWVMAVRDQQPLHIVNMDPIIHDVVAYETAPFGNKVMLHRPLRLNPHHPKDLLMDHQHKPGEAMIDNVHFSQGRRIFYLECGFHPYMQSWGMAVDNPYYAITDDQGNFTLPDIPEGVYKLIAWHPGMGGFLEMKVVVLEGDTLQTKMVFTNPKDRRMAHSTMKPNYRFGTEVLEKEGNTVDIQVTHEHQKHEEHD